MLHRTTKEELEETIENAILSHFLGLSADPFSLELIFRRHEFYLEIKDDLGEAVRQFVAGLAEQFPRVDY